MMMIIVLLALSIATSTTEGRAAWALRFKPVNRQFLCLAVILWATIAALWAVAPRH
jgi:hypothetical protein